MRILRFVTVLVLLLAGATIAPAAFTTALDPLVDAVLARRASHPPTDPHHRRAYRVLGRTAHILATPSTSISDDLRIVSAVIVRLRSSLKYEVELRSAASATLAELSDISRDEKGRFELWTGRLGDAAREASFARAVRLTERLFARAEARTSESARALLLARACARMDRTRRDLSIVGDPPQMPDFSIPDVNPASATYQQQVSPRGYVDKISAWYFGKAG